MPLYNLRRALARTVSRLPVGTPSPNDLNPLRIPHSKHIPLALRKTEVSTDISLSLQFVEIQIQEPVIPQADTFDSSELIGALYRVTENLCQILEVPSTGGKLYEEREKRRNQLNQLPLLETEGGLPVREPQVRKAYRIEKGELSTTIYQQSIWDLILPILQPPLNLDFPETLYLPTELFPHHIEGIEFLRSHTSALLADEMGTGKTVAATLALRLLFREGKIRRALVICPVSVVGHADSISGKPEGWDGHLGYWARELDVTVVRGNRGVRSKDWRYPAHVYVCTFDTLRNDILDNEFLTKEEAMNFDAVIVDEAQYIKNPKSGRAQAVRLLQPQYRWALTGTPLENKLDDLFAVFDFVKPGHLSAGRVGIFAGAHSIAEMIRPFTLRRLKRDIMKNLPPKIRDEIWFDLDDEQTRAYEVIEAREVKKLADLGERLTRIHIFEVIQKLKQICNFAPGKRTSAKTRILEEKVDEIVGGGGKVLIFSQYIGEGIAKLEQLLTPLLGGANKLVTYTGSMGSRERHHAIERFKTDPSTVVFLSTPKTGGVGLTLTEASYVIHFDHWWNPATMWQAEDRAHRGGQTETVNVYSLWAAATANGKPTIEARIYRKLNEKGLLFEKVLGGLASEQFESFVSMDDWLEVLGLEKPASWKARKEERPPKEADLGITDVMEKMNSMPPESFEKLVQDVLAAIGFQHPKITQRTHDGGVDVVASRSGLGGNEVVVFQCKRTGTVGVEHARALLGVLASRQNLAKGYIVTSGSLSQECKTFCDRDGRLGYLDGSMLANYVLKFNVSI